MASKDEYYQKIIATLQSDIKGVQQDIQKLSKRLEVLESSHSKPKAENVSSFDHKQFMARLNEWANNHKNTIRNLVVEMFVMSWNKAYPDLTAKSQFTQYQEEMKIKLTDIEERITTAEKNAGHRFSLFTLSRPTYITERYSGPDRHPFNPSFYDRFKNEIWVVIIMIFFTTAITFLYIVNTNNTLKADNAALRHAIEYKISENLSQPSEPFGSHFSPAIEADFH